MDTEHLKTAGDAVAATITVATIAKWLPAIAAFLSIIWTLVRLGEWVVDRAIPWCQKTWTRRGL